MFFREEVVQFAEGHPWCGCFGIINEIKDAGGKNRYLVGVPVPAKKKAEKGYMKVSYIYAYDEDLIKLLIYDSIENHTYNIPGSFAPIPWITTVDSDEEDE
jgi:hypothetical protein